MTDEQQAVREDIAFMRTLAEAGRNAPMAGGAILVSAGLIYATASLVTAYAEANELITNGLFFPIVWFGATALFMLCLFLVKGGQVKTSGQAAATVWSGAGWSIFAIVISLMIMSYRTNAWWLMGALAPIIVAIYGGAWFVGAVLVKTRWLYAVSFGSFLMAGVMAWFGAQPVQLFLIYAATLVGLLALPGYVLMRQARAA